MPKEKSEPTPEVDYLLDNDRCRASRSKLSAGNIDMSNRGTVNSLSSCHFT